MCTSLAEFATKFFVCENRRGQSYKAFIGLYLSVQKWFMGRPLLHGNLAETDPLFSKTLISNHIRL